MTSSTDLALVKIGGSIATAADEPDLVARPLLRRLASELRETRRPLIVVHGTGLVGKPWAHREGFALTGVIEPRGRTTALRIKSELRALDQRVVDCLIEGGLDARGMDFEAAVERVTDGSFRLHSLAASQLRELLADGTAPVFYGDMLREPDGSYRVISSDVMMVTLARDLGAETTLFLTDVEGVLDAEEKTLAEVSPATLPQVAHRDSDERDVSAGMRGKLRHAFAIAATSATWIANGRRPGLARDLLAGRKVTATQVRAER